MKLPPLWSLVLGALSVLPLAASAQSQLERGKGVYERWCIDCHGAGEGLAGLRLPGTEALEAKYKGSITPLLEERKDLTPEFVASFVRRGVSIMPFFRRTEISDADLAALGAYLARNNHDLRSPGGERK